MSERGERVQGAEIDPTAATMIASADETWAGPPGGAKASVSVALALPTATIVASGSQGASAAGDGAGGLGARPSDAGGPQFSILRTVGRGGMGVVYAARQGSLAREVAVKMLDEDAESDEVLQSRFVSEAVVTGALDHPNIVPVHDLGRDPEGRLYMAMKLVRGTSWSDLLHPAEGGASRSLREHLDVLLRVCDAVAFAHDRHVVHRDLKPDNVMVGAYGEVLVMDWGIAVDVRPRRSRDEHPYRDEPLLAEPIESATALAGTVRYMAPEQARGARDEIDRRTDVFLLGAILYEVLTGAPPHLGETVQMVLFNAALCEIQRPSERAPQRDVPSELERIALKAMAKDRGERFDDVPSLQRALREFLAHESSLRRCDEAARFDSTLRVEGAVARGERYATYQRARDGYREALALWPANPEASSRLEQLLLSWCDEALDRGDDGLAQNQLSEADSVRASRGANVASDDDRRAALRAAVARSGSSRSRAWLVAAMTVLAFFGVIQGLREGLRRAQASREQRERESSAGEAVARVWDQLAAGQLDEAMAAARSMPSASGTLDRERRSLVRRAMTLALWRAHRWSELFDWTVSDRAADAAVDPAEFSRDALFLDPALLALRARGAGALRTSSAQWRALRTAAEQGAPTAAIEAAISALDAAGARREPDANESRALRTLSLWGITYDAALRRGDAGAADGARSRVRGWSLDATALGAARPVVAGASLARVSTTERAWVARFAGESAPRWSFVTARPHDGLVAADGTFYGPARGQLVRLAPEDGRVLGRVTLAGTAVLVAPNLARPGGLLVFVRTEDKLAPAYVRAVDAGDAAGDLPGALQDQLGPFQATSAAVVAEARSRAGVGEQTSAPEAERAALRVALAQDPSNGAIAAALLRRATDAQSNEAREWLEVVRRADGSAAMLALLADRMDEAGARDVADALLDRALDRYRAAGADADLSSARIASPAEFARRIGARHTRSDLARALVMVERGHQFSRTLEGDAEFYQRMASWAQARGDARSLARAKERLRPALRSGGAFGLAAGYLPMLDLAIVVVTFTPWLFALLVLRLFLRSWRARREDLIARGFRTEAQRWRAFVTNPVERISYSFLAYASRAERLALAALSIITVLVSSQAVARIELIGQLASAPADEGSPFVGGRSHTRALRQRAERSASAAVAWALAEGAYQRREYAQSREWLRGVSSSGALGSCVAAADAAISLREAGMGVARAKLERAARGAGPCGNEARSLLAAIELRGPSAADLVWGNGFPRAHGLDLRGAVGPERAGAMEAIAVAASMLSRGQSPTIALGRIEGRSTMSLGTLFALLTALGPIALLALPFPVRSSGARRARDRDRAGVRWAWLRAVLAPLPGTWDLIAGRVVRGALMSVSAVVSLALFAVFAYGGVLTNIASGSDWPQWFGGPAPRWHGIAGMVWVGRLGLASLVALVVANVLLAARGVRVVLARRAAAAK